MLSKSRYLVGNTLTEADVRLVTTLFRFDTAYHGLFKVSVLRYTRVPTEQGNESANGKVVECENCAKTLGICVQLWNYRPNNSTPKIVKIMTCWQH